MYKRSKFEHDGECGHLSNISSCAKYASWTKAFDGASDEQIKYRDDLRQKLAENGVDVSWLRKEYKKQRIKSEIKALITIMKKNNLWKEKEDK